MPHRRGKKEGRRVSVFGTKRHCLCPPPSTLLFLFLKQPAGCGGRRPYSRPRLHTGYTARDLISAFYWLLCCNKHGMLTADSPSLSPFCVWATENKVHSEMGISAQKGEEERGGTQ
eukprot:TRINITY_DN60_c0_g2_i1.p2 TRINITY_DN60_c0_g2~~TRINITY_DN60_c0_g2_i1.p2  ORF type:complete len:116 (-),score=10.27 TRINITY_DN60_c0_g2_i1:138-485(-)